MIIAGDTRSLDYGSCGPSGAHPTPEASSADGPEAVGAPCTNSPISPKNRVQGLGFRNESSGFRVEDLEFRGLGFRGSGFRIHGLGFGALDPTLSFEAAAANSPLALKIEPPHC